MVGTGRTRKALAAGGRGLAAGLALLLLSLPAGAVDVAGVSATLAWTPASGPVAGYAVFLARNGGALGAQPEATTTAETPRISVSGAIGSSLAVQVAAFDAAGVMGPLSPVSEWIQFVPPTSLQVRDALTPALAFEVFAGPGGPTLRVTTPQGSVVAEVPISPPAGLPEAAVADARAGLCDLDGDGEDEVLLGFGGDSAGWLELRGGPSTGFAPDRWMQVPMLELQTGNGETHPACGDLDGDGRDEIAVGFGAGSGGWVWVVDDALAGFAPLTTPVGDGWIPVPWDAYNAADGSTHPACADLDADGRAELVVGLGSGSGGWLQAWDDAGAQFAAFPTAHPGGWFLTNWRSYNVLDGSTFPDSADLDADGSEELVVGLSALGEGRAQVFSVSDTGLLYAALRLFPPDAWLELGPPPPDDLSFDPQNTQFHAWLSYLYGPGAQANP